MRNPFFSAGLFMVATCAAIVTACALALAVEHCIVALIRLLFWWA